MCRLIFTPSDNHRVAASTSTAKRLLKQRHDFIGTLPDGESAGTKGEGEFIIIELDGVPESEMAYLSDAVYVPGPLVQITAKRKVALPVKTDYRDQVVDLDALRAGMSAEDKLRFDRDPRRPVNLRTGLRPCPKLTKAALEAEVKDRTR